MHKSTKNLTLLMGISALDGCVPLAALAGLFKLQNAPMIALIFMAGPAAIITAVLLPGAVRDRMIAALVAGVIATTLVMLAAGIGPSLLKLINIDIMRIFGGIAIAIIALIVTGLKIPDTVPMIVVGLGIIVALIWR